MRQGLHVAQLARGDVDRDALELVVRLHGDVALLHVDVFEQLPVPQPEVGVQSLSALRD